MTKQCRYCIHLMSDALKCDAFVDGIPIEILKGDFDHSQPHDDDNGIRFEE